MSEHYEFLRDRVRPVNARPSGSDPDHSASNPGSPPQPAPRRTVRPPSLPVTPRVASTPVTVHTDRPRQPAAQRPAPNPIHPDAERAADLGRKTAGVPSVRPEVEKLIQACRTPLPRPVKIGVLGKAGVGRTSIATAVGSILADLRVADRVVAVDADAASGRLLSRIAPHASAQIWALLADRDLNTFDDVSARLGRNTAGLFVLGGGPRPSSRKVIDAAAYREAVSRLAPFFSTIVVDCGPVLDSGLTYEVLRDLDALIVVSSTWADGTDAAARTLDWLAAHDMTALLNASVVVINDSDGHADRRTRARLIREFTNRGQRVAEVPFDPHLRSGEVIDMAHGPAPATRLSLLQVAATVVDCLRRESTAGHLADDS